MLSYVFRHFREALSLWAAATQKTQQFRYCSEVYFPAPNKQNIAFLRKGGELKTFFIIAIFLHFINFEYYLY